VSTSPYLTDYERRQHDADNGRHAAAAQAYLRLGLILEYDDSSPVPAYMDHAAQDGKVTETLWGVAAPPSAGDEAGCAAVDRFAARHHVAAAWEDGRYRASMHLGGNLRYGVFYMPERTLAALATPAEAEDRDACEPAKPVAA
jgi:hypothetical protein